MTNRKALKCTLGVVVTALFLAATWGVTAARLSAWTSSSSAVKPNATIPAPKKLAALRTLVQSGATVATDKSDYHPGEIVNVTGTGWQAGETVHLVYVENPVLHAPHEADAVADANGNISSSEYVIEYHDIGQTFTLTATGQDSHQTATTTFTDASPDGTGVVTVTSNNAASCVALTPANSGGPDSWEVVQGGSYTMTITGVTECSGDAITMFLQGSFTANFCFNAVKISAGTYEGAFTMPNPACFTYPISYKCGLNQDCNNANTFNANGPSNTHKVHLRASTFSAGCTNPVQDEVCTGGPQGCTIGLPPPDQQLGCNPATIPGAEQTVTGTCDGAAVTPTYSSQDSENGCNHTRVNTWTIVCGLTTCSVSQTITWKVDTTPPVLSGVPEGGNLGCNPTTLPTCSQAVTATDNCDGTVNVTCTPGAVTGPDCSKSQTFTYDAVDACGNPVSQSVTYTWKIDTTAPVLSGVPVGGNLGCNPTPPACATVTATDNCDGTVNVTCTPSAVTGPDCSKSQTFTYEAVDLCGNRVSQEVTYTWKVDTTAPVLANLPTGGDLGCNPSTLPSCSQAVTATDNCDGTVNVTCTPGAVTGPDCSKSQTFNYSAVDACGNTTSENVTYTWKIDTTAPVLSGVPEGGNLGCNPTPPSCATVTATDNCDGTVNVTCTPGAVTGPDCAKSQTFTYEAVDLCGNRASREVTYTWKVDTTAPVLANLPTGGNLGCNPTTLPSCSQAVTATDNCDGTVNVTCTPGAVTGPDCSKSQTFTYSAVDACGNRASQDVTYTWRIDITPPVLSGVPAGGYLGCNPTPPGCANVTATDNCDGARPVTCTPYSVVVDGCMRSQTFRYSAADSCGNPVSQSVTYTWKVDITPPVISCPSDKFYTSCDNCPVDPDITGRPTATDNCGGTVTFSYTDQTTGTCPRVITRTWVATDGCGNRATCQQKITCLPPGVVTNTERCTFDLNPDTQCKDFRLIFTQDPQNMPAYRLTASNPGQFFYNVFYAGNPGDTANFTMTLPYPFETQGANPVHAYSTVGVNINNDGSYCLTPGQEVYVGSQQVSVNNCGTVANPSSTGGTIGPLSLTVPSSGFLFIAIHVDYGLKGCSSYNKNATNDAVDFATGLIVKIPNSGQYQFSVSGAQNSTSTVCNINDFKKNPGVGGLSLKSNTDPAPGASITLKNDKGQQVGSATTDQDGWYQITYKHTGKPAIYTISIIRGSFQQTKTVELKANAYSQIDFTVP